MKLASLFFFTFLIGQNVFAIGGDHAGNGGDAVVQEFISFGRETVKLLPYLETKIISEDQKAALKKAILNAKIESQERLFLGSKPVDAINYPSEMRIEVSRSRWQVSRADVYNAHWALALHEYLWLAGINDTNYVVSNPLFTDLLSALVRWRSSPIARALAQAVCSGILGRDFATIESAMQMGADLSAPCENGDTEFTCKDGHKEYIRFMVIEYPLERALGTFGENYCETPRHFDPDQDTEMQKILDLMLSFRPDLTKHHYGPAGNSSLLQLAVSNGTLLGYESLLKGGADPNLYSDFGGLLSIYPLRPLPYFKAALEAGANINLMVSQYGYLLSVGIVRGPEEIMKYFVSNHKIDFCLQSRDPRFSNDPRVYPIIDLAKPEYVAFIKSIGDACTAN